MVELAATLAGCILVLLGFLYFDGKATASALLWWSFWSSVAWIYVANDLADRPFLEGWLESRLPWWVHALTLLACLHWLNKTWNARGSRGAAT